MKRIASFLILLALTLSLAAQNISVASFNLDEKDLTANLAGTSVEDQNGQKCALLRIQTTEKGFTFDVGVLGIQKVDDSKVGEIWVYVPAGVRRITLRHQQLGTLKDYTFPINIASAKTYNMQLTITAQGRYRQPSPRHSRVAAGCRAEASSAPTTNGRKQGSAYRSPR